MLDSTVDITKLRSSLAPHLTDENEKRVNLHLRLFNKVLLDNPVLRPYNKVLLHEGASALLDMTYWLSLEVQASMLQHNDDVVYRRCLHNFARAMNPAMKRPSIFTIYDTGIDLLKWHRESAKLGSDLALALSSWDRTAKVSEETRRLNAQLALQCLRLITEGNLAVKEGLVRDGLSWFGCLAQLAVG